MVDKNVALKSASATAPEPLGGSGPAYVDT